MTDNHRQELEREWETVQGFRTSPVTAVPGHITTPGSPFLAANYLGHYGDTAVHSDYAHHVLACWRIYIDTGEILNWDYSLWHANLYRRAA